MDIRLYRNDNISRKWFQGQTVGVGLSGLKAPFPQETSFEPNPLVG